MHSLNQRWPRPLNRLADEYQSYLASIQSGMAELRKQSGEAYDEEILRSFITFADDYLKLSKCTLTYRSPIGSSRSDGRLEKYRS